ncbi:MAG: hypothetical protein IKC53_07660 [Lentisphaeria bacterium]|nr:hypothetical protein [Lentisphaeria bacterium]MBR3688010.1 hypothetical protein [Lentisphaeria bacterium]
MKRRKTARPFTLIELIAVMGVMILLAAVAIPAYSSLFAGRKTTLAANQLNGAVMEARAHAVSAKVYTALVFAKDGNGLKSFRMAEVYHDSESETSGYAWRRWAPGTAFVLLPENTMIPDTNDNFGMTTGGSEGNEGSSAPKKVSGVPKKDLPGSTVTSGTSSEKAIIFKPNGQLAGTENKNMVVRFVESNRYDANKSKTPKLPLNINWLTCKTKFLDPVE